MTLRLTRSQAQNLPANSETFPDYRRQNSSPYWTRRLCRPSLSLRCGSDNIALSGGEFRFGGGGALEIAIRVYVEAAEPNQPESSNSVVRGGAQRQKIPLQDSSARGSSCEGARGLLRAHGVHFTKECCVIQYVFFIFLPLFVCWMD